MSSASSEQSCVRKGAGYNEVYLLGQDDSGTSFEEKVSSANSPSMEDDDLEGDRSKSDSNEDIGNDEPPVRSVIGSDGFREFIMLSLWMINDFNSSIKQRHFNSLKEKYQILVNIPMHLLLKREKCCYKGVEDIGVYEQMLKVGLRFLLSARHRHLFQYLGLVVTQISPNAWRVFLGAEVLYGVMSDEARRMTVEEFFHCYRPSEITQSRGMYSFVLRNPVA